MSRPEFLDLCSSRGLALRSAEVAWECWSAELGRLTAAEFDVAMAGAVLAFAVVGYLEETIQ